MRLLMWYLIVINIVTWIAFGLDKWKAKSGKWNGRYCCWRWPADLWEHWQG